MKIMKSDYKLLLLLPLLVFLMSVDQCAGAIGIPGEEGGETPITDLMKVTGTRATASLTVPADLSEDLIGTQGTIFCMDATLAPTFDLALAFNCGSVILNPGTVQTVLRGLMPYMTYLAAVYPAEALADVMKATATSGPVSNVAVINTDLVEVSSALYGSSNQSCASGYLNSDDILDIVCGGAAIGGTVGRVAIWFGTSAIPADNFPVAVIAGDIAGSSSFGWPIFVADVTGDGQDDLVIADPKFEVQNNPVGQIYFWRGPLTLANGDAVSVTSATQTILGNPLTDRQFGNSLTFFTSTAMGMSALLVGVPGGFGFGAPPCVDGDSCGFMRIFQWDTATSQLVQAGGAQPLFTSLAGIDYQLGRQASVGDYDGDGLEDLFFDFNANGNGTGCHVADVILGSEINPAGGSPTLHVLHTGTLCIPTTPGVMGAMLIPNKAKDLNGDGFDDFIVLEAILSTPQYRSTVYFGGSTVDPARSLVFNGTTDLAALFDFGDVNYDDISEFVEFNFENTSVFTSSGVSLGEELAAFLLPQGLAFVMAELTGDFYMDFVKGGSNSIGQGRITLSY